MAIMIRRRSSRSAIAQAGRLNSSQGRRVATPMSAMRNASSVRTVASHGKATRLTPSPRFETALEPQSFQ